MPQALLWADRAELLIRVTSLVNTLQFLRHGVFLTLTERLLRLRKRRSAPDVVSETNYTYLTREHLWRGFSVSGGSRSVRARGAAVGSSAGPGRHYATAE